GRRGAADREERCRVAGPAVTGGLPGAAAGGHRAGLERRVRRLARRRHVHVSGVRQPAVLLDHEVRVGLGVAQLLCAAVVGRRRAGRGPQPRDGAGRGPLRPVQLPPGPPLRRRAGAQRAALLHELALAPGRGGQGRGGQGRGGEGGL
ncbi:MAG: Peptide-methionine (R)-S-oxide reductase MsrB, partial [uncultured Acidimicrobiales bacterium]